MDFYKETIKDLQLRTVDSMLMSSGDLVTAEIVRWVRRKDEKDFCYTVVYWICGREGYDAKFVGDRFFEVNYSDLMELITKGQSLLNREFERTSE